MMEAILEKKLNVSLIPNNSALSPELGYNGNQAANSITNPGTLRKFRRLLKLVNLKFRKGIKTESGFSFGVQLKNSAPVQFGEGKPQLIFEFKNEKGIVAMSTFDEAAFCEAYMAGDIDLHGNLSNLFDFRGLVSDNHILSYLWCFIQPLLFGQISKDKKWIARHYDLDDDFYLSFLDKGYRCYSQGVFADENETLETGIERKLKYALDSIQVKPGDRVLDIGGGWGAFSEYAGMRNIKVTSLTISRASKSFVEKIIKNKSLPCEVKLEHFYNHVPEQKYDAIVNLGVTEHLPDYHKTLKKYLNLVKSGGRIYLDASASRIKYRFSSFIYKHIYEGNCSPLCLSDYMTQLAKTPLHLIHLENDRQNYYLTARYWSQRYEENKAKVIQKYGQSHFRKFQIYLWGTVSVFKNDVMQAYRLVLEAPH